jgi:beta-lactamase class D
MVALMVGCQQKPAGPAAKASGPPAIDIDKLNAQIDSQIGGLSTCVIIVDTASGRQVYHYGDAQACLAKLPPCGTFDIANSLIGLDLGAITPQTVFKWDGSPQPFGVWQKDADLSRAFKIQVGWWFQRLAGAVGHDRYVQQLRALDYGDHDPAGMANAFWLGPQAGGFLTLDEGQQVGFVRRFYAGTLPLKPETLATVQALTSDETRTDAKGGQAVISGRAASCSSVSDGSRNVGWWIGRIKTAQRDVVFSASVEGNQAPPGIEIERRLKDVFSQVGLLPDSGS